MSAKCSVIYNLTVSFLMDILSFFLSVYVETGGTTSTINAVVATGTSTTDARSWSIKVSQISCTSTLKAPEDCVQFFTGTSGLFSSYNFAGGMLIHNQEMAVCFRQEDGYCGIDFSVDEGTTTPDPFLLLTNPDVMDAVETGVCTYSRINIPQTTGSGYFCGGQFGLIDGETDSGIVRLMNGPFRMHFTVFTNTAAGPDISSTGYKMRYNEVPC